MDNQNDSIWARVPVVVIAVIGLACTIMIIVRLPLWGEKQAEWLGALGTIAAFFGTLWVAATESRRRRREELMRARLQAVAMKARVSYANLLIRSLKNHAETSFSADTVEEALNFCSFIKEEVGALDLWTIEDAALVIPLNNNMAGLLARELGEIQRLVRLCDESIENGLAVDSVRKDFKKAINLILTRTSQSIEVILAECKRSEITLNLVTPSSHTEY